MKDDFFTFKNYLKHSLGKSTLFVCLDVEPGDLASDGVGIRGHGLHLAGASQNFESVLQVGILPNICKKHPR
jgi:hypothetical protein